MFPLPCDYDSLTLVQQKSLNIIFDDQLKMIEKFASFLLKISSFGIEALQESHADWLKAAQYFDEQCRMHNANQFARSHISKCRTIWMKLGSSLVPNQLQGCSVPCSYPRCAYPTPLGGASLACGGCQEATYCSYRCQSLHWACDLPEGPHADLCSSSTSLAASTS
ncbi:hypothetical protein FRC12_025047 [Ceratobasidium sp. 428]|nr:hypothetical protein FRC12_025047 [Ceratobasidium sp. 428]